MIHYLFDLNSNILATFEKFDPDKIKSEIKRLLELHPNEQIEHCKCSGDSWDYWKSETLAYYAIYNNLPSKLIYKGLKTFYLPLS